MCFRSMHFCCLYFRCSIFHCIYFRSMLVGLNLNLNSLLVTRQMTLFHQGVRMGEKLVP